MHSCQSSLRFVLGLMVLVSCDQLLDDQKPDTIATFSIAQGFQIELVAMEPLISDPVAMEIDENGDVYVVEMHGYPLDTEGSGVVKKLYDDNRDGVFDRSEIFYDSLILPTGIMRWKQGVLVTDPPDLLYLEDTGGDGRADKKEVVLTGFALSNPQHNFNSPIYGLDNWIYLANEGSFQSRFFQETFGDEGEEIRFPGHPESPTLPKNANDLNVKADLRNFRIEMLSGDSQHGHTFDQWGHHFGTKNWSHIYHEVLAAPYIERNQDLELPSSMQYVPDYGIGFELFPITENPEHQLLTDVGAITSACGITWYLGDLFPEPYNQVVFVAEPTHNLVHTDIIYSKGATFGSCKQFETKEFLASTDGWFRPVNFYIGPDGALYMLDFYRKIIEHPEWLSEQVVNSGELYEGLDQGRIYRISPVKSQAQSPDQAQSQVQAQPQVQAQAHTQAQAQVQVQVQTQTQTQIQTQTQTQTLPSILSQSSNRELIQHLAHPNIWWRRHAQRMLVDRGDPELVPELKEFIQSADDLGVLHGLWTLDGLGHFDPQLLLWALDHPTAGVRENAIRIAELHRQEFAGLEQKLVAMVNDPDSKVRFQMLCTLGYYGSAESEKARAKLMFNDLEDPWVPLAALSASSVDAMGLLTEAVRLLEDKPSQGAESLIKELSKTIGKGRQAQLVDQIIMLIGSGTTPESSWWRMASMQGLAETVRVDLSISKTSLDILSNYFTENTDPDLRGSSLELLNTLGYFNRPNKMAVFAGKLAMEHGANAGYRADAIRVLAWSDAEKNSALFRELLIEEEDEQLRIAAIAALGQTTGPEECEFLIERWQDLSPAERDLAVDAFSGSEQRQLQFLRAVESGIIQASVLGWGRTVRLLNTNNEPVRELARRVLEGNETISDSIWQQFQQVLTLNGDPISGAQVFEQSCAICHQVGGTGGINYGPDLAAVGNRSKSGIMIDILKPNRSISDGYDLWTIEDRAGRSYSGIIVGENINTLTLRTATGEKVMIQQGEIANKTAPELSAMPEGLHNQISYQEMADLLEYLKQPSASSK